MTTELFFYTCNFYLDEGHTFLVKIFIIILIGVFICLDGVVDEAEVSVSSTWN